MHLIENNNIVNIFHNYSDRNTFVSRNITSKKIQKLYMDQDIDINNFKKKE